MGLRYPGVITLATPSSGIPVTSNNYKVTIPQILASTNNRMPYIQILPEQATIECTNVSDYPMRLTWLTGPVNGTTVFSCLLPRQKSRIFHFDTTVTAVQVSLPWVSVDEGSLTINQGDEVAASFAGTFNTSSNGYLDVRTSSLVLDASPLQMDDVPITTVDCFAAAVGVTYLATGNPPGTGAAMFSSSSPILGFGLWRNWSMYSTVAQRVSVQLGIIGFPNIITTGLDFLANMTLTSNPDVPLPPLYSLNAPSGVQFTGLRTVHFI